MTALIYFNPACSKCRSALSILNENHVDYRIVRYLDAPPSVDELEQLMALLSIDDPRGMMRTHEKEFSELGLATASRDELLSAITQHPKLLERPIFVVGNRAVIGRPPEKVLDLI